MKRISYIYESLCIKLKSNLLFSYIRWHHSNHEINVFEIFNFVSYVDCYCILIMIDPELVAVPTHKIFVVTSQKQKWIERNWSYKNQWFLAFDISHFYSLTLRNPLSSNILRLIWKIIQVLGQHEDSLHFAFDCRYNWNMYGWIPSCWSRWFKEIRLVRIILLK